MNAMFYKNFGSGKSRSLYDAVERGNLEKIQELTQSGVQPTYWEFAERNDLLDRSLSPLDLAIYNENSEVVDWLIHVHPDPFAVKAKFLALSLAFLIENRKTCYMPNILQVLKGIMPSPTYLNSAMYAAARVNDGAAAKLLIELGVNPNDNSDSETGWTFLMEAALTNSVEVVKILVESGADVDFSAFPLDSQDSAIRIAVDHENWDTVEYLLLTTRNKTDKAYAKRHLNRLKGIQPPLRKPKQPKTKKHTKFKFPKGVSFNNTTDFLPGLLLYQDFIVGEGDSLCRKGQVITIRYERKIASGRCIESSPKCKVTVGTNFFGKDFTESLLSMR
ncbi:ankyrin repeat domain-containing protein, partial [Pseudanabaenaceae cyanobacterium LEGE 13415]|nr:ankyrin repeat domain-containing protein [Pseudanabaenaceae cyanobacterium LEGE 13415]